MNNPYQGPRASVAIAPVPTPRLEDVAQGQKLVIYAILMNLLLFGLNAIGRNGGGLGVTVLSACALLACVVLGWTGIYRLARGLGCALWLRLVLLPMMLVPLLGLLIMLMLSGRATKHLRAAGYSVGLLGARAP